MKEEETRHWSPSYPISGTNLIEGGSSSAAFFPAYFSGAAVAIFADIKHIISAVND